RDHLRVSGLIHHRDVVRKILQSARVITKALAVVRPEIQQRQRRNGLTSGRGDELFFPVNAVHRGSGQEEARRELAQYFAGINVARGKLPISQAGFQPDLRSGSICQDVQIVAPVRESGNDGEQRGSPASISGNHQNGFACGVHGVNATSRPSLAESSAATAILSAAMPSAAVQAGAWPFSRAESKSSSARELAGRERAEAQSGLISTSSE